MEKRLFLALALTAFVIFGTRILFPGASTPIVATAADSTAAVRSGSQDSTHTGSPSVAATTAPALNSTTLPQKPAVAAETTTVATPRSTYRFSSLGGAPVSVVLDSYPSHRLGVRAQKAELLNARAPLARFRLALGADTIALDTVALQRQTLSAKGSAPAVSYTATVGGRPLRLDYEALPDSFLIRLRASVAGAPAGTSLLVDLPRTLQSNERDTLEDMAHLAVSYRDAHGDVTSVPFAKLDSAKTRVETGPLRWVAARNKYFLLAYRTPEKAGFSSLALRGVSHAGKVATEVQATAALPLARDGSATVDIYAGPQDFRRLQRLGADLDQVNPYGGFLNGVVQPFASIVMRALLWMKDTTRLNYGWVLVLFGVLIKLALWPLQQGAMRTSLKMQRLQPELQAIQKKYGDDRQRQQEAMMKLYKDHGMSPLSPLMGCLPMLIPMPILYALYHVFQNTVEFRGVPFLWLPDLSLHDPYFITPVLMGLSMFAMSWIGMRNSPPNPQAKMMMYMMPVMLTVFFLKLASGLNLYYAVQNLAGIPQQWLLARERAKAGPVIATVQGPGPTVKRRS